jgi:hypothetical protein
VGQPPACFKWRNPPALRGTIGLRDSDGTPGFRKNRDRCHAPGPDTPAVNR